MMWNKDSVLGDNFTSPDSTSKTTLIGKHCMIIDLKFHITCDCTEASRVNEVAAKLQIPAHLLNSKEACRKWDRGTIVAYNTLCSVYEFTNTMHSDDNKPKKKVKEALVYAIRLERLPNAGIFLFASGGVRLDGCGRAAAIATTRSMHRHMRKPLDRGLNAKERLAFQRSWHNVGLLKHIRVVDICQIGTSPSRINSWVDVGVLALKHTRAKHVVVFGGDRSVLKQIDRADSRCIFTVIDVARKHRKGSKDTNLLNSVDTDASLVEISFIPRSPSDLNEYPASIIYQVAGKKEAPKKSKSSQRQQKLQMKYKAKKNYGSSRKTRYVRCNSSSDPKTDHFAAAKAHDTQYGVGSNWHKLNKKSYRRKIQLIKKQYKLLNAGFNLYAQNLHSMGRSRKWEQFQDIRRLAYAATVVQKMIRCWLLRRTYLDQKRKMEWVELLHKYAISLQCWWRPTMKKRRILNKASTMITQSLRVFISKKRRKLLISRRMNAAKLLQHQYRAYLYAKKQRKLVTHLQALYRGRRGRIKLRQRHESAIRLQRFLRLKKRALLSWFLILDLLYAAVSILKWLKGKTWMPRLFRMATHIRKKVKARKLSEFRIQKDHERRERQKAERCEQKLTEKKRLKKLKASRKVARRTMRRRANAQRVIARWYLSTHLVKMITKVHHVITDASTKFPREKQNIENRQSCENGECSIQTSLTTSRTRNHKGVAGDLDVVARANAQRKIAHWFLSTKTKLSKLQHLVIDSSTNLSGDQRITSNDDNTKFDSNIAAHTKINESSDNAWEYFAGRSSTSKVRGIMSLFNWSHFVQ